MKIGDISGEERRLEKVRRRVEAARLGYVRLFLVSWGLDG